MRIPLVRAGNDFTPIAWWEWLFAPIMMPIFFLELVLLCAKRLISLPFINLNQWKNSRVFAQAMQNQGRFIAWEDLQHLLANGEGTLIIEQSQHEGVRIWWTPNKVVQETPIPPPNERDLDYLQNLEPPPFVPWCYERYLSPTSGKAMLTVPSFKFPPGVLKAQFFRRQFPGLSIIMTVTYPFKP